MAVKVIVIVVIKVENAAGTVIKSTEINDNYIPLTETKLILFINNAVLKNTKLKTVLTVIL